MNEEPDLGTVALFLLLKHCMLEFKLVVGSTSLRNAIEELLSILISKCLDSWQNR